MAELASSIVTIAQVSLAIIKETVRYIQEVRLVDTLIDRLLTEFKELHDLIKVVHSTYKHALAGEAIASSTFVGKYVEKCKDRLYQMQKLVVELASRDTDSIARKFSAQRRYKTIRKDIEMATDDIHRYIKHIRTGMACWNLYVYHFEYYFIPSNLIQGCCFLSSSTVRGDGCSESSSDIPLLPR